MLRSIGSAWLARVMEGIGPSWVLLGQLESLTGAPWAPPDNAGEVVVAGGAEDEEEDVTEAIAICTDVVEVDASADVVECLMHRLGSERRVPLDRSSTTTAGAGAGARCA